MREVSSSHFEDQNASANTEDSPCFPVPAQRHAALEELNWAREARAQLEDAQAGLKEKIVSPGAEAPAPARTPSSAQDILELRLLVSVLEEQLRTEREKNQELCAQRDRDQVALRSETDHRTGAEQALAVLAYRFETQRAEAVQVEQQLQTLQAETARQIASLSHDLSRTKRWALGLADCAHGIATGLPDSPAARKFALLARLCEGDEAFFGGKPD